MLRIIAVDLRMRNSQLLNMPWSNHLLSCIDMLSIQKLNKKSKLHVCIQYISPQYKSFLCPNPFSCTKTEKTERVVMKLNTMNYHENSLRCQYRERTIFKIIICQWKHFMKLEKNKHLCNSIFCAATWKWIMLCYIASVSIYMSPTFLIEQTM